MTEKPNQKQYVGIDVSKSHLDVHIFPLKEQLKITNDAKGHKTLRRHFFKINVGRIIMEATGRYFRDIHQMLSEAGFEVSAINLYRARKFADITENLQKLTSWTQKF